MVSNTNVDPLRAEIPIQRPMPLWSAYSRRGRSSRSLECVSWPRARAHLGRPCRELHLAESPEVGRDGIPPKYKSPPYHQET
jgi:hypothetical protein